jgi:hypothetical protein
MFKTIGRCLTVSTFLVLTPLAARALDLTGWTGAGNYGTSTADGVVTLAPGGAAQYGWVSTYGGVGSGSFNLGVGGETNGSYLRSSVFTANANEVLDFKFNFVTSDGAGFADYAWARLLDSSMTPVDVLFTARQNPNGVSIPGFGMPTPNATIAPFPVSVHPGGPVWSKLGGSSGHCWSTGCGYTDWVDAKYTIPSPGSYVVEFGVVNYSDTAYDTGMAFDSIKIGNKPIGQPVPEPVTFTTAVAGLGLVGWAARRKSASTRTKA